MPIQLLVSTALVTVVAVSSLISANLARLRQPPGLAELEGKILKGRYGEWPVRCLIDYSSAGYARHRGMRVESFDDP